jgi:ribosomal-protein-alanine N-acetyltransferase
VTALETAGLILRPFGAGDASAHAAIYADPEVTRYLPGGPFPPDTVEARSERSLTRFAEHWTAHGWGVWAVVDKASGGLIGQCGLNHLPDGSDVELLYALSRSSWGRGLATEAGRASLEHGFGPVGLERIVAVTRPEHWASRRVMERLGMAYEADRDAFGMQVVCYALSREAWRRARTVDSR